MRVKLGCIGENPTLKSWIIPREVLSLSKDPVETARRDTIYWYMIQSELHSNMQNAVEMSASRNKSFGIWILRIWICLEIRNWDLEIPNLLRSNKIVDTLVVHAVNYGHWLFEVSTLQVAKLTR